MVVEPSLAQVFMRGERVRVRFSETEEWKEGKVTMGGENPKVLVDGLDYSATWKFVEALEVRSYHWQLCLFFSSCVFVFVLVGGTSATPASGQARARQVVCAQSKTNLQSSSIDNWKLHFPQRR